MTIVSACVLYVVLRRENRRREKLDLELHDGTTLAFKDLTDKENLHFRYAL